MKIEDDKTKQFIEQYNSLSREDAEEKCIILTDVIPTISCPITGEEFIGQPTDMVVINVQYSLDKDTPPVL